MVAAELHDQVIEEHLHLPDLPDIGYDLGPWGLCGYLTDLDQCLELVETPIELCIPLLACSTGRPIEEEFPGRPKALPALDGHLPGVEGREDLNTPKALSLVAILRRPPNEGWYPLIVPDETVTRDPDTVVLDGQSELVLIIVDLDGGDPLSARLFDRIQGIGDDVHERTSIVHVVS